MVGPSFTPSKYKGKQLTISSEESDADRSPGLKDALAEPEGVTTYLDPHRNNRPINYSLLARGIEVNDEHSTTIRSWSSNSSSETTTFAYIAETPEEVAKRFKEKARV